MQTMKLFILEIRNLSFSMEMLRAELRALTLAGKGQQHCSSQTSCQARSWNRAGPLSCRQKNLKEIKGSCNDRWCGVFVQARGGQILCLSGREGRSLLMRVMSEDA
jgi:hypothetical protein